MQQVVRVKKKDTGQEYALKVMDKRHIMREKKVQYVKMERLILDQLDHPGVTRLHFTFQDNLYLCILRDCFLAVPYAFFATEPSIVLMLCSAALQIFEL